MTANQGLGDAIRRRREEAGLRQADVAESIGVHPQTYHGYETGRVSISEMRLEAIARALKTTPAVLRYGEGVDADDSDRADEPRWPLQYLLEGLSADQIEQTLRRAGPFDQSLRAGELLDARQAGVPPNLAQLFAWRSMIVLPSFYEAFASNLDELGDRIDGELREQLMVAAVYALEDALIRGRRLFYSKPRPSQDLPATRREPGEGQGGTAMRPVDPLARTAVETMQHVDAVREKTPEAPAQRPPRRKAGRQK